MESVYYSDRDYFLSYNYLNNYGVGTNTIKKWIARESAIRIYNNSIPFIKYSSIPKASRSKLPSEADLHSLLIENLHNDRQEFYNNLLKTAYEKDFLKYKETYSSDDRLSSDQKILCARLRAVWEKVLAYNSGARGVTEHLFKAFNTIFKGKYETYAAFCTVKSKARKNIDSVVIDTRWFREQHSPIDPQIQYWAKALLCDPVNRTAKSIWRDLEKLCAESKLDSPSYSWIKKFVKEHNKNVEIHALRNGREKSFNDIEPYARINHALHVGSQWQIDGWDLPFYYQGEHKGKLTSYLKLVLFAVRDAHSKKIVGYSIGESENTQLILEALQDAVKNTGFFAFEILSDNHSFNKTKEAEYFKEALDTIGVTWSIDQNPRRKAIAERYFKHLGEAHCKKYNGYIGQSIKTKEKTGRPSQEYQDQFTKSGFWLTKDEIKLIGVKAVEEFNNTPQTKLDNLTPNEVHERGQKPYILKLDLEERLRLFTKKTELTVIRGQINLTRGGVTYEYQLDSEQFTKLNGKKVIVRYEDYGTIYLFDHKDRSMGLVHQKVAINGALADQTQEDIEKFHKNKGRLNGIKAKARKANEKLRDEALAISPEAFEALNRITTPKDILKEVQQSYELRQRAQELGINLEMVEVGAKPKTYLPESLREKREEKKSPFSVRGNHQPKTIDLSEYDSEE